jgi:hypothetical protein
MNFIPTMDDIPIARPPRRVMLVSPWLKQLLCGDARSLTTLKLRLGWSLSSFDLMVETAPELIKIDIGGVEVRVAGMDVLHGINASPGTSEPIGDRRV